MSEQDKIIGTYFGIIDGVKLSKDATSVDFKFCVDITKIPVNTAEFIRQVIENPGYIQILEMPAGYQKSFEQPKRGPGRPPKSEE